MGAVLVTPSNFNELIQIKAAFSGTPYSDVIMHNNDHVTHAMEYFTPLQLSICCELKLKVVNDYINNRVIVANGPGANLYSISQLERLRRARRLQDSLNLEVAAVARVLFVLERIATLEKRTSWVKFIASEEDDHNLVKH